MGHYDSAYESDERERRKETRAELKRVRKIVDALAASLGGVEAPDRFAWSLDDLGNWLDKELSK